VEERTKILVTGAKGFVGRALVSEFLTEKSFKVFGLGGRRNKFCFPESIERNMFTVDISDLETLRTGIGLKDVETIVHCAGLAHQFKKTSREDFWRVNVSGTENICRLAERLNAGHFILISSVSVYGKHDTPIDETFECRPEGFYAESKLESELRAIDFCRDKNIRLTILRPATIIGEGDRGNTARLITLIDKGRFFWIGEGVNKKSLVYKGDVAKCVSKVLRKPENGQKSPEIYNVAAEALTMREVVESISLALKRKPTGLKIPESFGRRLFGLNKATIRLSLLQRIEATFEKWLSNDEFSGQKFFEEFGYRPQTGIGEALAAQVENYLKTKKQRS
jgi:nucleoside-diphosphate-sugar epimerase